MVDRHHDTLAGRVVAWWRSAVVALQRLGRRYMPSEGQHVFALTLVVGAVCGLAAVAFHLSIRLAERLLIERALHAQWWMLWTVVSPGFFGLVAGVALAYIVPGARGSGIPQVKVAYALGGGRVPFRDAVGKFILGALQIGSGASLGREGPTVQICAGTASMLARATSLPEKSRRKLMPVGVAAGIAAAFNAPIAAVTFTIEEIVGDLDQTVLSGVVVAAALAAVIERSILGAHPVIEVAQGYGLEHASSLPFYGLLGVAAAGVSVAFSTTLLRLRARFQASTRLPKWAQPAVGGLVAGAVAVIMLKTLGAGGVTGGGYPTLGLALAGRLAVGTLAALCVAKLVATVASYSSGGAGGIFAPSLFMGGMIGGVLGFVDTAALGHHGNEIGAFALVGMGAVFAGVVRAPITSVLIIFEMTGGYGLVLPLMIANMISYGLARRWSPVPIYEALLEQDGVHLPRAARALHPLEQLSVRDDPPGYEAALRAPVTDLIILVLPVDQALRLEDLMDRLLAARQGVLPVVLDDGHGIVSLEQVRDIWREVPLGSVLVTADLARKAPLVSPDAHLAHVIALMNAEGLDALPIGDVAPGGTAMGVVTRSDIGRHLFGQFRPRRSTGQRPAVEQTVP